MRGELDEAAALLAQGMEIVRNISFAPARILSHTLAAKLAQKRGDRDAAWHEFERALALAEASGAAFVGATIHLALAETADGRGDHAALAAHLGDAHARFKELKAPIWAARAEALAQRNGVVLDRV
jgi:tetratricopeptide (TPR) repeat protein